VHPQTSSSCVVHACNLNMVSPSALLTLLFATGFAVHAACLSSAPSNEFVEVRPQLWRYNGEFAFIPSPAQRTPVAVWLVEVKSSWILIDTGAASPEYKDPFLAALKRKLSSSISPLLLILRKPCTLVWTILHTPFCLWAACTVQAVLPCYFCSCARQLCPPVTKRSAFACSDAWSPRPCWTVAMGP